MSRSPVLAPGDRVRFSRAWLQSTATYTGELPRLRGTVAAICSFRSCPPLVTVNWDHPYFGERATAVLATNLQHLP